MGKKLAITGHPTRGKEVIELLEMMGGENRFEREGSKESRFYYIDKNNHIQHTFGILDYYLITLEEFLEKYPFKVGDKVMDCFGNSFTIKSMDWSENCETIMYEFDESNIVLTPKYLQAATDNHTKPSKMKNVLAELLEHIKTTPKEELEKEFKEIEEWSNVGPTVNEFRAFCECVNKKPKYPTTYEECWKIRFEVDGETTLEEFHHVSGYYSESLGALQKLLCCRDAYWKIAGEEMGLGELWKPDWNDYNQPKFGIHTVENQIRHITLHVLKNLILVFPTEEMRDAFYDNFKDLIEQCKELL